MRVYAFDVDETLEIANGPVTLASMQELRDAGNVVGICGNWAGFVQSVRDWHKRVSFVGQMYLSKELFLNQIGVFVPAEEHIMVGNIFGVSGGSDDQGAAESDFAAGAR